METLPVYIRQHSVRATAIAAARQQVADLIGASPKEIIFTGGGSEGDNMLIKGVAHANVKKGRHIITTQVEHHAVLHTCEELAKEGFEITYLPVDEFGRVTAAQVEAALRDDTILVSVMYANNEIGTIMPIREIGAVAAHIRCCCILTQYRRQVISLLMLPATISIF